MLHKDILDMKVGYRRVSTIEQNLDRQELSGCDRIFEEKVSGATKERTALNEMISFVRDGDEVEVYSIDRLARNLGDLQQIIAELNAKGVSIKFVSEGLKFSGNDEDPFAKLQLHMLGAFAEFERSLIKKRQLEGIAKAKERGVYTGRKKQIDDSRIRNMKLEGASVAQIASEMGISRQSVYRGLKA